MVVDYDATGILPTADLIFKDYYTLEGWYEDANFESNPITTYNADTSSDTVLYAKWVLDDNYAMISFDCSGSSNPCAHIYYNNELVYKEGEIIKEVVVPKGTNMEELIDGIAINMFYPFDGEQVNRNVEEVAVSANNVFVMTNVINPEGTIKSSITIYYFTFHPSLREEYPELVYVPEYVSEDSKDE